MKKGLRTLMGPQLLWRLTRWNALQVLAKTASGLVSAKVYAAVLGPAGLAHLGAFRNLLSEWEIGATLGLENSLIREWADPSHEVIVKKQLASTAAALMLVMGSLLLLLSILFYPTLEFRLFHGLSLPFWFWMGCWILLPLYWAQQWLTMLLNGLGLTLHIYRSAVWGSVLNILITLFLVLGLQLEGAMWSLLAYPALMLGWYAFLVHKHVPSGYIDLRRVHWPALKPLLPLSIMGLMAAVLQPILQWYIRQTVWNSTGIATAGYVEGLQRLSSFGLVFVSSLLAYYFLPVLTQNCDPMQRRAIIQQYVRQLWPLYLLVLLAAWVTQALWLPILFSDDFARMSAGLGWQFTGDALRALSLLGGYFFFVEKKLGAFVVFELSSTALWAGATAWLVDRYGWVGAPQAYVFTYVLYTPAVWWYARRWLKQ